MSITGCTDQGDGRLVVTVDHDPRSTATDVPAGSIILYVGSPSDYLWTGSQFIKLDDGATTNVHYIGGSWYSWTPVFTGFSADPTGVTARYTISGKTCIARVAMGNGTSNATAFTITLPVAAASGILQLLPLSFVRDNGATQTDMGVLRTQSGVVTADVFRNAALAGWTASSTKKVEFTITYETI